MTNVASRMKQAGALNGHHLFLVVHFINTVTFAARDFSARRGASDAHIPKWICKERATKSGRKRTAALRVAPNLACGGVARRSQIHFGICSLLASCHRPNWAQRTSSYLCIGVLRRRYRYDGIETYLAGVDVRPTRFRLVGRNVLAYLIPVTSVQRLR